MKQVALKIILTIISLFAPIQTVIISSILLIAIDLVTGMLASHKQGYKITSAGMQRTIIKLLVYEGAILLGFIAEHFLMQDALPISKMIAGYIGLTELTSCLENLNIIGGGNLLKTIIVKLGSQNKD